MEPQINTANTKDWLEASKDLKIKAYIEAFTPTSNLIGMSCPQENLYEQFLHIGVPFIEQGASPMGLRLETEFESWDQLSDEALIDFEKTID